jgi:hypothetical protein
MGSGVVRLIHILPLVSVPFPKKLARQITNKQQQEYREQKKE